MSGVPPSGPVARYGSGGPWEDTIGYSRVVAAGPFVLSAGCTSTVDGKVAHVGDAAAQARVAFRIALDGLARAGAQREHVVRTRMYLVRRSDADAVGRVHGEIFGDVRPVATMLFVAGLIDPEHLVEVEVEAYLLPLGLASGPGEGPMSGKLGLRPRE